MTQPLTCARIPKLAAYVLAVGCGPVGAWLMMQTGLNLGNAACASTGLLTLLLVAPVAEEIVFRYGLQRWLAIKFTAKVSDLSLANVNTAIIFAMLHALHQRNALMLLTFVPSLFFGWVWELSAARLIVPILLHAWYNLCLVIASC